MTFSASFRSSARRPGRLERDALLVLGLVHMPLSEELPEAAAHPGGNGSGVSCLRCRVSGVTLGCKVGLGFKFST